MLLETRNLTAFCLCLLTALVTLGCTDNGAPLTPRGEQDQAPVVARVGTGAITAPDFKAYLAQRPLRPGAEGPDEAVQERLQEMIKAEVLYQEAIRLKLDEDPEVRRNIRQLYVQKLKKGDSLGEPTCQESWFAQAFTPSHFALIAAQYTRGGYSPTRNGLTNGGIRAATPTTTVTSARHVTKILFLVLIMASLSTMPPWF